VKAKVWFPARYKGPFESVNARMNFAAIIALRGEGVYARELVGDANWIELDDADEFPDQWGGGDVGRTDAGAVKVASPYQAFSVETVDLNSAEGWVDLIFSGGEVGKSYLVTVGIVLSNDETISRSAAISIAQL
jgi:hypothetical protein